MLVLGNLFTAVSTGFTFPWSCSEWRVQKPNRILLVERRACTTLLGKVGNGEGNGRTRKSPGDAEKNNNELKYILLKTVRD